MASADILDRTTTKVATQFLPIAYGSFSSTQTQQANPAAAVVYNTEDITPLGVSCATPSANIVVATAGVYRVLASLQCDNTAVGALPLDMWVSVGGVAVPNSATRVAINQNQEVVMAVEWLLQLAAGASVAVQIAGAVGTQILAVAAAPPIPAIPSIITTIQRIA